MKLFTTASACIAILLLSPFNSSAGIGIAKQYRQQSKADSRIAANEEGKKKKSEEEELDIDPAEVEKEKEQKVEKEPERVGEAEISTEEQVDSALKGIDFTDKQKLLKARRLVVKGMRDIGEKAKHDIEDEEKDHKEREELNRSVNEWMKRTK